MMKRTIIMQRLDDSNVIPFSSGNAGHGDDVAQQDASLLLRICAHDHVAFAILVRKHTSRFFRVAYRFVGNRSEAEDIVQDAFLKLWEKPDSWQAEKNTAFTTWFHRIVVNRCLDRLRKKRPLPLLEEDVLPDERQTHEELMLEREKQRMVDRYVAQLPERQRTALNLCFYEGLSNQEAADIMGLRLKALQALLMRAKTTLKENLKFLSGDVHA